MTASPTHSTNDNKTFQVHDSISELVDQYDGFILDQFGVMHNGLHGLEGAPSCVAELAKQGKRLVILSNSSSLSENAMEKLPQLGFEPNMFVGAVTSGEEASHYIRKEFSNQNALFLTWMTPKTPSPLTFLEQCGRPTITDKVEEADFIILHGCQVLRGPGADGEASETDLGDFAEKGDLSLVIEPLLQKCATRNLPMVCANPDFIMVKPDGNTGHMPGKIAQRYEELGGSVTSFGKPHKEHFDACVKQLGLPKEKIVHIGDSLHHDIQGANATGIDSIFVAGGVHRGDLGCELGSLPSRDALEKLFAEHDEMPTHVVPMLRM